MTQEEAQTLKRFETQIRQLIISHKKLHEKYISLQNNYQDLENTLKNTKDLLREKTEDYERMKMARMLSIGNEDIDSAKKRVDKLIRKLNKCISMINV